ncbi:hypothetical protein NP493_126g03030 [Ridgeia piscesae]|uniref:Uncharacterized protein n=1 Tax=Ridgeia piscesae TaxID=27915 RepID=A0AAD9P5Q6_RIDPI|nr:hypothetical protein NP493_126g03030 [Ridgeia piscesae]
MKGFYNGLKEVWGPKTNGPVHLKLTDGMETFSDSKRVVARWGEQFQKLLNVPGGSSGQHPAAHYKDKPRWDSNQDEIARAIAGLKDGKAPGGDGIPAEVWKHEGDNLLSRLHQLITNVWELQEKCIEQDRPLYMVFVDSVRRSIQLGGLGYGNY